MRHRPGCRSWPSWPQTTTTSASPASTASPSLSRSTTAASASVRVRRSPRPRPATASDMTKTPAPAREPWTARPSRQLLLRRCGRAAGRLARRPQERFFVHRPRVCPQPGPSVPHPRGAFPGGAQDDQVRPRVRPAHRPVEPASLLSDVAAADVAHARARHHGGPARSGRAAWRCAWVPAPTDAGAACDARPALSGHRQRQVNVCQNVPRA